MELGLARSDRLLELRFDPVDRTFGVAVAHGLEPAMSLLGGRLAGKREIAEDHDSHQAATHEQELDDVHVSRSPILIATPGRSRGRSPVNCTSYSAGSDCFAAPPFSFLESSDLMSNLPSSEPPIPLCVSSVPSSSLTPTIALEMSRMTWPAFAERLASAKVWPSLAALAAARWSNGIV